MHASTPTWFVVAIALLGLGPAASQPAQPDSTNFTIEEQEGDDGKPVGRRMNPDDADLGNEVAGSASASTVVRQDSDPFYRSDEPGRKLAPLPPGKDIVTCVAGCDGPPGTIVYKK